MHSEVSIKKATISQAVKPCSLVNKSNILGECDASIFYPEDVGNSFLHNVGSCVPMASHLRQQSV
jgi:hypothetical protein